jgi:hypothetical protein
VSKQSKTPKSPLVLLTSLSILVVATLVVASGYFLRPGIELELKKELISHFASTGFSSTIVHISGRDVILNGAVENKADALKAEKTAKEIWGVRQVDNQLLIKNQSVE